MARGVQYLKEALARDPGFAIAWEALGGAYLTQENAGWFPTAEGRALAREAKKRALSLEPDLAEAHAGMGMIQRSYDWDWRAAEASYARALELAPGNALVLRRAATMAMNMGRLDEWVDLTRRAVEQDPLSAGAYHNHGYALSAADRHAEAEAALRKALELTPLREATHWLLAAELLAQGRVDEALAVAVREPGEFWHLLALAVIHHGAGHRLESDQALRELIDRNADAWAAGIAEVHAARGEVDPAFEWLERAYAQRDAGLTGMKLNPQFRALHGDPRWGAFLKRMGLPD